MPREVGSGEGCPPPQQGCGLGLCPSPEIVLTECSMVILLCALKWMHTRRFIFRFRRESWLARCSLAFRSPFFEDFLVGSLLAKNHCVIFH